MSHYFEEPGDSNINFLSGKCNRNIGTNHKSVKCSICNYRIHMKYMKYNKTDVVTSEVHKKILIIYFAKNVKM